MYIDFFKNLGLYKSQEMNNSRPPLLAAKNGYSNLAPLKKDTVSFHGAEQVKSNKNTQKVKKSDFSGFDAAIIEKYRVNISGFKSVDDLQTWAQKRLEEELSRNNYEGRQDMTSSQRDALLTDWKKYVTEGNSAFTPVMKLMILTAITKDLKETNDELPPVLDKGVLADTLYNLKNDLKMNPKMAFDFNKLYKINLKKAYLQKTETSETGTKWIVIPSKKHDPENFTANVDKLKVLSHKNWCTKSFNAEPYLKEGDFHVFIKDGEPKVGVRFIGDKIQEIQGERNNDKIPCVYYNEILKHIEEGKYELHEHAQDEVDEAQELKEIIDKLISAIGEDAVRESDPEKILPHFGIKVKKDSDGMLIISSYKQPSFSMCFEDLGINEDKMFKRIKEIQGDADFSFSNLSDLHNLKKVNKDLIIGSSKIKSLKNLESIGGSLYIESCEFSDLGNLKFIGANVDFRDTAITSLKNLEYIGGDLKISGSDVDDLGNLEEIGGSVSFNNTGVTNLGKLKIIGGKADFSYSDVKDLGELEEISGDAIFEGNETLKSLGNLQKVYGDLILDNSKVKSLGSLSKVGGDASFKNSCVQSPGSLTADDIGGAIYTESSCLDSSDFYDFSNDQEYINFCNKHDPFRSNDDEDDGFSEAELLLYS